MTKHIGACRRAKAAGKPRGGDAGEPAKRVFHLVVEGGGPYWLHLAVPEDAPLSTVDGFLRRIWLECCQHMSAFTIAKRRYSVAPMRELDEKGMNVALGKVLQAGMKFGHEYDYGSTTDSG